MPRLRYLSKDVQPGPSPGSSNILHVTIILFNSLHLISFLAFSSLSQLNSRWSCTTHNYLNGFPSCGCKGQIALCLFQSPPLWPLLLSLLPSFSLYNLLLYFVMTVLLDIQHVQASSTGNCTPLSWPSEGQDCWCNTDVKYFSAEKKMSGILILCILQRQ